MNYYALFYEVVDDFPNRRAPFRQEHLRLANEARERGEIVFAGALAEPADRALIVFYAEDKSKVESFARNDPYVQNGLVKKWEVRLWNVVVGNEPPTSSAVAASGTILRRWTARTTEAQLPKYLDHFSKNVLPELRRVPGYLGATVSLRLARGEARPWLQGIQGRDEARAGRFWKNGRDILEPRSRFAARKAKSKS